MAKKSRTPAPPRKVQAPQRRAESRQRRSPEDRRTLYFAIAFAASGVAAIAVVFLVLVLISHGSGSSAKPIDESALIGLQTGPAPWNTGLDHLPDRLQPLGLNQLGKEGTKIHIHQHLDIFVDGKHVTVPANVGIYDSQFLTELHTHDATGIVHVESPTKRTFTLGQFFGDWGVRLTNNCIGGYCRPKTPWRMYVNGVEYPGNPSQMILKAHQEIAFAIGKPPKTIPSTYNFGGL